MDKVLLEVVRMRVMMGLAENVQVADKVYFKTGTLPQEVRDAILNITDGDNFTKLVTDCYMQFTRFDKDRAHINHRVMDMCEDFYDELVNYDKKLFPIPGNLFDYGFDEKPNERHVLTLYELLTARNKLVYQWSKVPSIIKRNLAPLVNAYLYDSEFEIHGTAFTSAAKIVKEIIDILQRMPEEKQAEVVPKLFSSKVKTLGDVQKGIQNLQNTMSMLSSDMGWSREEIFEKVQANNAQVVADNPKAIVVRVNDAESMQELGCFSSWCFAIPGQDHYWDDYAGNGYVYIIYNFTVTADDARFMMTYLPTGDELFLSNNTLFNDVYYEDIDSYQYLRELGIDPNKQLAE